MILDHLVKAAFGIINTVAPALSPERFLEAMRDDFDPNLSDEENKKRMMQKIREGKVGEAVAEAASYEPKTGEGFPVLFTKYGGVGAGVETGAGTDVETGADTGAEGGNTQTSNS